MGEWLPGFFVFFGGAFQFRRHSPCDLDLILWGGTRDGRRAGQQAVGPKSVRPLSKGTRERERWRGCSMQESRFHQSSSSLDVSSSTGSVDQSLSGGW